MNNNQIAIIVVVILVVLMIFNSTANQVNLSPSPGNSGGGNEGGSGGGNEGGSGGGNEGSSDGGSDGGNEGGSNDTINKGVLSSTDSFTLFDNFACSSRNDLYHHDGNTLEQCRDRCSNNPDCTAFEYRPSTNMCTNSSTCNTVLSTLHPGYTLGVKGINVSPPGNYHLYNSFDFYPDFACSSRNDLYHHDGNTMLTCANRCSNNPDCNAFEYRPLTNMCTNSSTCNYDRATSHPGYTLGIRK